MAKTELTTLSTIKLGASASSFTLIRYADGSFGYTGANGKLQVLHGDKDGWVKGMFDQIAALT